MSNIKHEGINPHRFPSNPEENRFAKRWKVFAERNLKYLVHTGPQNMVPDPTQEQATVAATVIQWLGSPCGQYFLKELGYQKVNPKKD